MSTPDATLVSFSFGLSQGSPETTQTVLIAAPAPVGGISAVSPSTVLVLNSSVPSGTVTAVTALVNEINSLNTSGSPNAFSQLREGVVALVASLNRVFA
jgi:hypothetical protein